MTYTQRGCGYVRGNARYVNQTRAAEVVLHIAQSGMPV